MRLIIDSQGIALGRGWGCYSGLVLLSLDAIAECTHRRAARQKNRALIRRARDRRRRIIQRQQRELDRIAWFELFG